MTEDLFLFGNSYRLAIIDELGGFDIFPSPADAFWLPTTVTGRVDCYFRDEELIKGILSGPMTSTSDNTEDWTWRPQPIETMLKPLKTDTAVSRFIELAERPRFELGRPGGLTP